MFNMSLGELIARHHQADGVYREQLKLFIASDNEVFDHCKHCSGYNSAMNGL